MIWNHNATEPENKDWHRVFVWWPTDMGDGRTVWLQWVERRFKFALRYEHYEYREVPSP